jgi:hypothetical protein
MYIYIQHCFFTHHMDYVRLKENTLRVTQQPLAGTALSNLMRVLIENKFDIDIRYLPRLLYAITISSLATPLRIKEHLQFDSAIKNTEIEQHPLFILGHWRSGTTYLHNLLSLDTTRGYVSTLHALIPGVFLGSGTLAAAIVAKSLPKKRPMDDVSMGTTLPQEDEYALAALCPYSPNHQMCFPRNSAYYDRFISLDDVSPSVREAWREIYQYLLQKETLSCGGKQLVLKNPSNTARVNLVYHSMMRLPLSIIPYMCLQQPPAIPVVEHQVFEVYKQMYIKYLNDRGNIPHENLVEIRYEDFIRTPVDHLKLIYERLDLDGFQTTKKKFIDYIALQDHVKKQQYTLDEHQRTRIYEEWKFAFDAFHYEK